uniref:Non-lysosomal glucosylceramidase n=2 Tax=Steinernema glaseri TaxID=37863 RepID=A0A1I7YIE9_9BILA
MVRKLPSFIKKHHSFHREKEVAIGRLAYICVPKCHRRASHRRRTTKIAASEAASTMTVAEVASTSASSNSEAPAEYGWTACGDKKPKEERVPFNRPTMRQVYDALPFVRRYSVYWLKHIGKREKLFINTFQPLKHKPHYGVPCGTIGSGSIGRDFRGGFCKFGLRPGLIEHKVQVLRANQFILTVRRDSNTIYQKVLSAADFSAQASAELSSWDFSFPSEDLQYRGLFPRSWTTYRIPDLGLTIVCRQISPVIPHDYEESSLPTTVFVFDVENESDDSLEVSIAFTFRNGTGYKKWKAEAECYSRTFEDGDVSGVCLEHKISGMQCNYSLSVKRTETSNVTCCRAFDPSGTGEAIWKQLKETGDLEEEADDPPSNELGVAVCAKTTVEPKSSAENPLEFALVWHMPVVEFGGRKRPYRRRYTRFYGVAPDIAEHLALHALKSYKDWERRIDDWQNPVLQHPKLPDWYKSAIFNELYFLVDGGSLWFEYEKRWSEEEKQLSEYSTKLLREYGRFGYLESWEYRMVNTYDVHFYASFALAELWPSLQHVIQAEMTDHVEHFDEKPIVFHMEGDTAPQKTRLRVPHDLGNPAHDPWMLTNAYVMHDTGKWKDLNLKFVLTTYRDYAVLRSDPEDRRGFLQFAWPVVKSLMEEGLKVWDKDGDGMIENFGAADQTYDAWRMNGVSAYCGSLWLAALRVTVEMAKNMGEKEVAAQYHETLQKAKAVYVERLWNGEYFNFDEFSRSKQSIMADQLCGYWFLESVDPQMAAEIIDKEKVGKALDKIYNFNVKKFASGRMGAVNGMNPNGKVDRNYIQADEMWTGISYALAAFFVQQGEVQRGFDTAWGPYDASYNRFGLQYQTPEALYERKYYRAIGYMRPLSIWAIHWSLRRFCQLENSASPFLSEVRTGDPEPRSTGNNSDDDEGIGSASADDDAGASSSNE